MGIKYLIKRVLNYIGYEIKKKKTNKIDNSYYASGDLSYDEMIYYRREGHNSQPIFKVETKIITNSICFAFSDDGWHPFVSLLKDYINNEKLIYNNSILDLYYKNFTPKSMAEIYIDELDECKNEIKEVPSQWLLLPWELTPRMPGGEKGLDLEHGIQVFGPVSKQKGQLEFDRVIKTYKSIKEKGFNINQSTIYGQFLKNGTEYRFKINSGNHRVPALSVLKYNKIPVALDPRVPRVIDIERIDDWPQVKNGLLSKKIAKKIFLRFFHHNGSMRAKELGLI